MNNSDGYKYKTTSVMRWLKILQFGSKLTRLDCTKEEEHEKGKDFSTFLAMLSRDIVDKMVWTVDTNHTMGKLQVFCHKLNNIDFSHKLILNQIRYMKNN